MLKKIEKKNPKNHADTKLLRFQPKKSNKKTKNQKKKNER